MSRRLSAMIIANLFPPEVAVGTHRTVGLCRHLVERDWQVTVIAARPSKASLLDEELLEAVPKAVRVVRTAAPDLPIIAARLIKGQNAAGPAGKSAGPGAATAGPASGQCRFRRAARTLVNWLSLWLHIPDGRTGWFFPALWAGLREGFRHRPDVIFSSAPVWTGHVVAAALSRMTGVPFVADFRDPWCGSEFRTIAYRSHRHVNRVLERAVVRSASRITCAWDGIRRHLAGSYPGRAADVATILNGFDPEAIDGAAPIRLDAKRIVFLHSGSFYGPRSPVPLLKAVKSLRTNGPPSEHDPLFAFVGMPTYNGRPLADIVREHEVDDDIRVVPLVPHRQAIGLLKGADVALLFGQSGNDSLASIPAKAYEYIGAGKPVLAIGAGQEVCGVMREGGCRVWSTSAEDQARIASAIRDIVGALGRDKPDEAASARAREKFTRRQMASRLENVLLEAVGNRPGGRYLEPVRRHADSRQRDVHE
jgi:glycosyltransferase involved in cell wall biosynthesis